MEKMMKKLSDSIVDKVSMDFLRNQVLKNAYGNDDTFIARRDPRILLVWYLFFALVPWFVDSIPFLLGAFLLVTVTTIMARVAGLVLLLFGIGVFSQTGYLFVVSLFFGGNVQTIAPLLILTLKVATVSLRPINVVLANRQIDIVLFLAVCIIFIKYKKAIFLTSFLNSSLFI